MERETALVDIEGETVSVERETTLARVKEETATESCQGYIKMGITLNLL